jgi:hypothetical protein
MPDRFGQDFNAASPVDSDFAQRTLHEQGAQVLRNLKSRIKNFYTKMFELEGMDFHDNVIPSQALLSLDPDPTEEGYREVTANTKGLVIRGKTAVVETGPQPYRAIMYADSSLADFCLQETPLGPKKLTPFAETGPLVAAGPSTYYVIPFEMFVPEKVTAMHFHLAVKASDEFIDGVVNVTPGEIVRVELWNRNSVGTSGHSNLIVNGETRRTGSGNITYPFGAYWKGSQDFYRVGNGKGFAILEWYA